MFKFTFSCCFSVSLCNFAKLVLLWADASAGSRGAGLWLQHVPALWRGHPWVLGVCAPRHADSDARGESKARSQSGQKVWLEGFPPLFS